MRIRHIDICGWPDSTIFFYIITLTPKFSEKKIMEHKMRVWISSTTGLNISQSKMNRAKYDKKNVWLCSFKVPVFFLLEFNET
jgi:hypothetical protein